jgi:hypothetical protein
MKTLEAIRDTLTHILFGNPTLLFVLLILIAFRSSYAGTIVPVPLWSGFALLVTTLPFITYIILFFADTPIFAFWGDSRPNTAFYRFVCVCVCFTYSLFYYTAIGAIPALLMPIHGRPTVDELTIINVRKYYNITGESNGCYYPRKINIRAAHFSRTRNFKVWMCIGLYPSKARPWLGVGQQIVVKGRQSPLASIYNEMWPESLPAERLVATFGGTFYQKTTSALKE